jgi:hypothetical protein
MRWKLKAVEPIGTSKSPAMVCTENHGCSMQEPEMPVYPISSQGTIIALTMKERRLGLFVTAKKLGMSATELSGIREGRLVFESHDEFEQALKRLSETAWMDLGVITQPYKGTRDDLERLAFDIQRITMAWVGKPVTDAARHVIASELRTRLMEEAMSGFIRSWNEKYEIEVEQDENDPCMCMVVVREK